MTRYTELTIAKLIGDVVGIQFQHQRFGLGDWGQADDSAHLGDGTLVCLEVEGKQKHPCTNVIKFWPYLDANKDVRVILIQTFFRDSPGLKSNRGRLCGWYAELIKKTLELGRFERFEIVVGIDGKLDGINELKYGIDNRTARDPAKDVVGSKAGMLSRATRDVGQTIDEKKHG